MEITSVSIKKGLIELSLIDTMSNEQTSFEKEKKEKSNLVPHQDLLDSVYRFKYHVVRVISREWAGESTDKEFTTHPQLMRAYESVEITSVTLKGNGHLQGIIIDASMKSSDGGKITIKTPKIRFDESASYNFAEQLSVDWSNLIEEASLYQTGEKFNIESVEMEDQPTLWGENDGMEGEIEKLLEN